MLSLEQRESLEVATLRYAERVEFVLPFLQRRGIDRATADSRGLGYVADPIPGHKPAVGRLSIPYLTDAGPVGMAFRCIEDHSCKEMGHPKYWKPKSQSALLYGVQDDRKADLDIHIAEGELDCITLSEMCGLPAFGISGAQYWLPWWKLILSDYQRIFVYCDGDDAGRQLGDKIQKEVGMSVIPIQLPPKEDVNSMYIKQGSEYLKGLAK